MNELLNLEPKLMEGIPNHRIILSCNDETFWYQLWMMPLSYKYYTPFKPKWDLEFHSDAQIPLPFDMDCPGC